MWVFTRLWRSGRLTVAWWMAIILLHFPSYIIASSHKTRPWAMSGKEICVSVCPSVSMFLCLCLYVCMPLCVLLCLAVSRCVSLCLAVSLIVSLCLFMSLCVPLSLSLSFCVSLCMARSSRSRNGSRPARRYVSKKKNVTYTRFLVQFISLRVCLCLSKYVIMVKECLESGKKVCYKKKGQISQHCLYPYLCMWMCLSEYVAVNNIKEWLERARSVSPHMCVWGWRVATPKCVCKGMCVCMCMSQINTQVRPGVRCVDADRWSVKNTWVRVCVNVSRVNVFVWMW